MARELLWLARATNICNLLIFCEYAIGDALFFVIKNPDLELNSTWKFWQRSGSANESTLSNTKTRRLDWVWKIKIKHTHSTDQCPCEVNHTLATSVAGPWFIRYSQSLGINFLFKSRILAFINQNNVKTRLSKETFLPELVEVSFRLWKKVWISIPKFS